MVMILERFAYTPFGTFGKLVLGDLELYTVERPWLNNQPRVSCVPEGSYTLEPHSGGKYTDTWALVGDTVSHWPDEGKRRSTCVFHAGNTYEDVKGCIAPGLSLDPERWGVRESRIAVEALRKEMYATQCKDLMITQYLFD